MHCPKCRVTPGYHSFQKCGNLGNQTLFYTAPAKTNDYNQDGNKLEYVLIDIETETSGLSWSWIMDCRNMGLQHYTDFSFNWGILSFLTNSENIHSVWILHPNIWMQATIECMKQLSSSNIFQKIQYLDGTKLEVMNTMSKAGFSNDAVKFLLDS